MHSTELTIDWVVPPPSNSGNEGLWGFPTKNVIILVVTLTGRGDNPNYRSIMISLYAYCEYLRDLLLALALGVFWRVWCGAIFSSPIPSMVSYSQALQLLSSVSAWPGLLRGDSNRTDEKHRSDPAHSSCGWQTGNLGYPSPCENFPYWKEFIQWISITSMWLL